MPPRSAPGAVITVLLQPSGVGTCPVCNDIDRLITIKTVINGESGVREPEDRETCHTCFRKWLVDEEVVELARSRVFVTDVIDPSKERSRRKERNKKATRREIKAGKDIGGSRVVGSGSGCAKGDARNDRWMVEDKHTEHLTFTLRRNVIEKALAQAATTGRDAVIRVGLGDGTELAITLWSTFAKEVMCED